MLCLLTLNHAQFFLFLLLLHFSGKTGSDLARKITDGRRLPLRPSAPTPVEFQLAFQCRANAAMAHADGSLPVLPPMDTSKNPALIATSTAPVGSSAVIALVRI